MSPDPDPRAQLGARLLADTRLRESASLFLELLESAGVVAAPIKGLVTSALLYPDPLDRPFGDVDVLVAPRDLPRVVALARARRYRLVHDSRQLGTVNVVIPPGLPMDVRASIGPPGFARPHLAERMLARAAPVRDPRVVAVPFRRLADHDHLLVLLFDAVLDKLALRRDARLRELALAAERWAPSPARFAADARAAGLAAVAWVALTWLHRHIHDARIRALADALEPLPALPRLIAGPLLDAFQRAPYGPAARLGVRLLADAPARGAVALALGAAGTARYHLRHRGRDPWAGVLWRGPGWGEQGAVSSARR